jgi:hypothetical protein
MWLGGFLLERTTMKPPKRLFNRNHPDDDHPHQPGQLRNRMHDPDLQAEIRAADIILGADPKTGAETGPYYGVATLRRIVRRNASEKARVLMVPVDPDTDDIEVLCAMVEVVKGAHCYMSPAD